MFLEDFSGHFFQTEMRRKNPATKSTKNPAAQKQKSAKNPFCQNPTLIIKVGVGFGIGNRKIQGRIEVGNGNCCDKKGCHRPWKMVDRTTKSASVTPELIPRQLKSVSAIGYLIPKKSRSVTILKPMTLHAKYASSRKPLP